MIDNIKINKLLQLSALSATEEEKQKFIQELNAIMDWIDSSIVDLPTPTDNWQFFLPQQNILLREDIALSAPSSQVITKNAAMSQDGMFEINKIIE